MINQQLVKMLEEMAELKEVLGENRFKIAAYQRAAQNLAYNTKDIAEIYREKGIKGMEEIEGIGQAIAEHIEEYIKTGKVRQWDKLRAKVAPAVLKLMEVPAIGPKTAVKLADALEVVSIAGLEKSLGRLTAKNKAKLAEIGLKEKSVENILRGIDVLAKQEGRTLLVKALPVVEEVTEYMRTAPNLQKFDVVGSFRRWKETVGDIDFMGATAETAGNNAEKVIEYFVSAPFVDKVIVHGETKATVIHSSGQQLDFEVLPIEQYGSLLQHFTGSKQHNVALRTWGVEHGFSISEHGIKRLRRKSEIRNPKSETNYKSQIQNSKRIGKLIKCDTEEKVYKTLGMEWIPPELREDRGEVEAALKHELPKLLKLQDIKGDLQVHTNWSDGYFTVYEMAKAAQDLGWEYIALTDHSVGLGVARGLDGKRLGERQKAIDAAQKKLKIKILSGVEVNVKANGELDLPNEVLKQLDWVLAAIHSSFNQDKATMTKRIIGAIENPFVHAVAHPTGRLIEKRPSYEADWEEVFKAATRCKKFLEIDGFPDRLDLPDYLVKKAKDCGVKFSLGTDSHKIEHLPFMRFAVAVARRGWLTKNDIINSSPLKKLLELTKRK